MYIQIEYNLLFLGGIAPAFGPGGPGTFFLTVCWLIFGAFWWARFLFESVFFTNSKLDLFLSFRKSKTRPINKTKVIAPRIIMTLCFLSKDVQYVNDNRLLFLGIVIVRLKIPVNWKCCKSAYVTKKYLKLLTNINILSNTWFLTEQEKAMILINYKWIESLSTKIDHFIAYNLSFRIAL